MSLTEQLGVHAHDLQLDTKRALQDARRLGVRFVELSGHAPDMTPSVLSLSGRRHLLRIIDGQGLKLAAITADFSGVRLTDHSMIEHRIEQTRDMLRLASDLHVHVVSTAIGSVTHPETGEPSSVAVEALQKIGEAADTYGICLALRVSADAPQAFASLLAAVGCASVGLGLDLGAVVMAGQNPLRFVEQFAATAALVHVRDARLGHDGRSGSEVAMGEGDVDLISALVTLEAMDYRGAYILRRTNSNDTFGDLMAARQQLHDMPV